MDRCMRALLLVHNEHAREQKNEIKALRSGEETLKLVCIVDGLLITLIRVLRINNSIHPSEFLINNVITNTCYTFTCSPEVTQLVIEIHNTSQSGNLSREKKG